ncbi:hypothetical protein [Glycomyces xiaoerkulensis]|uniref:hypothetical protein n=1 Tax=Glycomyces xiaoerkulensis TaxID=2038139 RepID=UPI000C25BEFD|nr:hypothetical protein [Glycomyces xiaoerkulensis]
MVSPPPTSGRRAAIAAVWLTATFAGLVGAVWAVGWALSGGSTPSLTTVAGATHLRYPDSTEVVEADLAELHTPTTGARAEVTVAVPTADFGAFIADNDMDAPLLSGTTPAGAATGIIPGGCTREVCYAATFIVDDDTVTVELHLTVL